ncbi:hypothetical protein [Paenibacillus sp. J22TS3]|uniref:hypothetical protein n=1 Tax=Paenibacillus sp. J22TS3 TaxID=2807192 RepID=UPI001B1ED0F3|nr:hypothetical protein [Paenibacillus sp. J22TS3]GIP21063.1 hypothetical protein J22TS3_13380 [Paenibacillus sp. J22TS3]
MRAFYPENSKMEIVGDEDVLKYLVGVDPASYEPIDISNLRLDMDELAALYTKAQFRRTPAATDAYKRHKDRMIAWSQRRLNGERYE